MLTTKHIVMRVCDRCGSDIDVQEFELKSLSARPAIIHRIDLCPSCTSELIGAARHGRPAEENKGPAVQVGSVLYHITANGSTGILQAVTVEAIERNHGESAKYRLRGVKDKNFTESVTEEAFGNTVFHDYGKAYWHLYGGLHV